MMITVVDVYDVAAAIGKDFEVIIDQFGVDAVSQLMPKVISVLEELEDMAIRQEQETHEISALKSAVSRLEAEKMARALDRARYEKELEQIEETWRSESQELLKLVDTLQEENRRLNTRLNESGVDLEDDSSQNTGESKAEDVPTPSQQRYSFNSEQLSFVNQLQDMIKRQRFQIRQVKAELSQREMDLDALTQCSQELVLDKVNLKRRFCVDRKPADKLREQESDLEAQVQAKEEILTQMRTRLRPQHSVDRHTSMGSTDTTVQSPTGDGFSSEGERLVFVERMNAEDKMLPGDDSAHYSFDELRQTVRNRCDLQMKLAEIKEELEAYRRADDDDRPVQGPINREPDEKLRPDRQKEIGIKQFFNRFMDRLHDRQ